MSASKLLNKKWPIAFALIVVLLVGFMLAKSSGDNQSTDGASGSSSTVSAGNVYNYRSDDGKVTGAIKVVKTFSDGLTSFDFVFIINDDVPNNGFCQSNDPTYCNQESAQQAEEIEYRYGLTFASTESSDNLVAAVYEPIYCNLEQAKADLFNIGYDKIDVQCDGWMVANWKPTNWFVAKNRSSTKDFSEFLTGLTLNVYDIADEYTVRVTARAEDGGSTITTGGLSYDQILDNKKVNSFSLKLIDN